MRARHLLPTIVLELAARLSLFGSVFALFASQNNLQGAATLAAIASVAGFARTWWRGHMLRVHTETLYRRLVDAVASKPTTDLMSNREHGQAAGLVDAVFEIASMQAIAVPDFIGSIGALIVVLVLVSHRLGPMWLGVGAILAVLLFVIFAPARKAARRARERGWSAHMRSAKLLDTLLLASAELRAAGRELPMANAIEHEARILSRAESTGIRLGAVTSVLPALLAASLVVLPSDWILSLFGSRAGEVAVLGAAGVSFALAWIGSVDTLVRSAPVRATLNAFLGCEHTIGFWIDAASSSPRTAAVDAALRIQSLEFHDVSVRHLGATDDTPERLSFSLRRGGVALVGPNGTGKSTAILAAVGLVSAKEGDVLLNGVTPSQAEWCAIRRRALLVPQRPHVVADESIAWHLGVFGTHPVDEAAIGAALDRVGLSGLRSRASARGDRVSALPIGELSGGEQRRVALARALLHDVDLVLVDEPEAGLDQAGRTLVGNLLRELSESCLVVLVAHDPTVVPHSFEVVDLGSARRM